MENETTVSAERVIESLRKQVSDLSFRLALAEAQLGEQQSRQENE
ncbi:hypothetical protein [Nocardioides sp.]